MKRIKFTLIAFAAACTFFGIIATAIAATDRSVENVKPSFSTRCQILLMKVAAPISPEVKAAISYIKTLDPQEADDVISNFLEAKARGLNYRELNKLLKQTSIYDVRDLMIMKYVKIKAELFAQQSLGIHEIVRLARSITSSSKREKMLLAYLNDNYQYLKVEHIYQIGHEIKHIGLQSHVTNVLMNHAHYNGFFEPRFEEAPKLDD